MLVYRFERNGIGPFVGGLKHDLSPWNKIAVKKTKHIRNQIAKQHGNQWSVGHDDSRMFGCSSKKALRAYFGYRFKPLFAEGYRIKTYKVPDEEVIDAGIQCSFPVKYHKLKTIKKLKEATAAARGL